MAIWARKLIFSTTDLIFPGFYNATDGKKNEKIYRGVRVRSSVSLQALLYADALFFIMWVLAFLCTFDISMSVLKELHGNLVVCMTALFIIINVPRLLFGFKGNERDKLELLALFWMTTLIVQAPLLGFLLFTDIFTPVLRAFTTSMDSIMMLLIVLEFIFGTVHLKNLIKDELRIIKLAKLTEISPPIASTQQRRPTTEELSGMERFKLPIPLGDDAHASTSGATPNSVNDQEEEKPGRSYYNKKGFEEEDSDSDDWSSDGEEYERAQQQSQKQSDSTFRQRYLFEPAKVELNIRRLPDPEAEVFTADEEEEEEEEENDKNSDDGSNVVTSTSDVLRQRSTATRVN